MERPSTLFKSLKVNFFGHRSDHHRVYTEEVNKIALNSNDDKRIQAFDKVNTYPYSTNVFMICKNEMLSKNKFDEAQVPKNKS